MTATNARTIINTFIKDQNNILAAKQVVAYAKTHPTTECVYGYEVSLAKTVITKDANYTESRVERGTGAAG